MDFRNWEFRYKFYHYSLWIIAVLLLMLIVILTPCYTEICLGGNDKYINDHASDICLMVFIPFLSSMIGWLWGDRFRRYGLDYAMKRVEQDFNRGLMSPATYKDHIKALNDFDLEKKKLKWLNELAKIKAKKQAEEMGIKAQKEINNIYGKEEDNE